MLTLQAPLYFRWVLFFLTSALPTLLAKSPAGSATKPLPSVHPQTISTYLYQQLIGLNPYVFQPSSQNSLCYFPTFWRWHLGCSQTCSDTLTYITLTLFNSFHTLQTLINLTYFSLTPKIGIDLVAQYQLLTRAVLSSSFSVWKLEEDFPFGKYGWDKAKEMLSWLSTFTYDFCLFTPRLFFLCGASSYLCLPTNWSSTCTFIHHIPYVDILPNNQFRSPF
jgi:hypothetical protein